MGVANFKHFLLISIEFRLDICNPWKILNGIDVCLNSLAQKQAKLEKEVLLAKLVFPISILSCLYMLIYTVYTHTYPILYTHTHTHTLGPVYHIYIQDDQ